MFSAAFSYFLSCFQLPSHIFSHVFSYTGTEDESFDYLEDFLTLKSTLPLADRIALGHDLDDMILGCTWQGYECSAKYVACHDVRNTSLKIQFLLLVNVFLCLFNFLVSFIISTTTCTVTATRSTRVVDSRCFERAKRDLYLVPTSSLSP